jgi:hypothetical protein
MLSQLSQAGRFFLEHASIMPGVYCAVRELSIVTQGNRQKIGRFV